MIISSATGDNPQELFPMLWFGDDKPDVKLNGLVKDLRPRLVSPSTPDPVVERVVEEVPKASTVTQGAEFSESDSLKSQSDVKADPASVVKDLSYKTLDPTPIGSSLLPVEM